MSDALIAQELRAMLREHADQMRVVMAHFRHRVVHAGPTGPDAWAEAAAAEADAAAGTHNHMMLRRAAM
jgi:hypothetical protein